MRISDWSSDVCSSDLGVPAGVINIVAADREVGAYLVSHPDIDKVAFTGSTAAGRAIAAQCGQLLRPVTLELGGKSAALLLEDVALPAFLPAIPLARMLNHGQACLNGNRIPLPGSRSHEIIAALCP